MLLGSEEKEEGARASDIFAWSVCIPSEESPTRRGSRIVGSVESRCLLRRAAPYLIASGAPRIDDPQSS